MHAAASRTLLEVLRDDLDLVGTKQGCDLGQCGACTVLLDGEPVLACLTLARECEGRAIETVESFKTRRARSAARRVRRPRRGPVRLLHVGHAHRRALAPPAKSAAVARGDRHRDLGQPLSLHGLRADHLRDRGCLASLSMSRVDLLQRALGDVRFTADFKLPRMLHAQARALAAPARAHRSASTSRRARDARRRRGDHRARHARALRHHPVDARRDPLALETRASSGDAVAAVAATDERSRPRRAPRRRSRTRCSRPRPISTRRSRTPRSASARTSTNNVRKHVELAFGDVDAALASAASWSRRLLLRGHRARADRDALRDRERRRQRAPHGVVDDAGAALPAPRARRACSGSRPRASASIQPPVGGAFGGKSEPFGLEFAAAKLAMIDRSPGEDPAHARGGVLRPPRPPPDAHAR